MNRFALFLASLVPAVGGLWMATEKFAALVAYDPAFLGSSLIIGGTHIYPPWAFVTWYFRYQRYVPELFSTVTPGQLPTCAVEPVKELKRVVFPAPFTPTIRIT